MTNTSDQVSRLTESTKLELKSFGRYFSKEFITQFYSHLSEEPDTSTFIDRLSPKEFLHLKARQSDHLLQLTDPNMTDEELGEAAHHVGRIHGMIGLTVTILSRAYQLQTKLIIEGVARYFENRSDRDKVRIFLYHRILEDLSGQLIAMQTVGQQQTAVLTHIEQALQEREPASDIIGTALSELAALYEMQAVVILRPDRSGRFQIERYEGDLVAHFLDHQSGDLVHAVHLEDSPTEHAMVRAWATGTTVVVDNYLLSDIPTAWHQVLEHHGVRSGVTLPLKDRDGETHALCLMCHRLPGYFSGTEREVFLSRVQELLGVITSQSLQNQPIISHHQRQAYRNLLQDQGLVMYYQPVVNLKTHTLDKVEALARLREPSGRIVPPNEFLPSFGQKELLTLFTKGLGQALKALHTWQSPSVLGISVNFPPAGIGQLAYIREIKQWLETTHTDPARLTLELLETDDRSVADTAQGMADLKRLGIRLAQDDLGSGYSSLVRMGRIKFDEVKIDQGLVRHLQANPRKALEFIHHLTSLGHDLDSVVTVEGVEHAALLEAASILGADYAQGYWISRPMPQEALMPWMKQFRMDIDGREPKTALGAFAASILWHSQLRALTPLPEVLVQFVEAKCPLSQYIETKGLKGTHLDQLHDTMHVIARSGISHSQYYAIRSDIERLLGEQISIEAIGAGDH